MTDLNFEITIGRPNPKDYRVLSKGTLLHHAKQGHQRTSEVINIFLKDIRKKVFGGVIATVLWNGIEINSLWVDESLRGQGYGKNSCSPQKSKGESEVVLSSIQIPFLGKPPIFTRNLDTNNTESWKTFLQGTL